MTNLLHNKYLSHFLQMKEALHVKLMELLGVLSTQFFFQTPAIEQYGS
jgi:hypothetical protein